MTRKLLPYGRQWIDDGDIAAVVDALRSDWITQGELVDKFESALAAHCGAKYAVAVSSGTAALHLSCLAAGIGPGQATLTSPLTFVASANCALLCGGRPYMADIDERTYNIDPNEVERVLNQSTRDSRISALLPVHLTGQPCNMESIGGIARKHGLRVIEDASHALGASWIDSTGLEQQVGNCSHSDMTAFSFHPVKHITTGEGGAILTNEEALYERLLELRNHGITKRKEALRRDHGPWYYEMQGLGLNYRITDFQCALGMAQLGNLSSWVDRRNEIASAYNEAFRDVEDIITPHQLPGTRSAYHLYSIQISNGEVGERRRRIFESLREHNIGVQVHYIPVHLHPYYQDELGYREGDFPSAELYYSRCISLPMFPKMTQVDIDYVIETCVRVVRECSP